MDKLIFAPITPCPSGQAATTGATHCGPDVTRR